MTYVSTHETTIKITFPCLPEVILCLFAIHPSLYSYPQTSTDLFSVTVQWLACSGILCKWNQIVCPLFAWFLSLRIMILNKNSFYCWIGFHYGYHNLFSHLPWETFGLFLMWGYYNKAAFSCVSLCVEKCFCFSFFICFFIFQFY